MKKISLFVLALFVCLVGHSQSKVVICGKFTAPVKIKVQMYEPIYGYDNMSFYSTYSPNNHIVNNSDSFYFKSIIDSAVTITCYITDDKDIFLTKAELVLFPKDSIHLDIDLNKKKREEIVYTGSNAAGQYLFNDINYDPVFKYQKVFDRLRVLSPENKASFVKDIDACVQHWTMKFDSLYKDNKISKAFYDYNKVAFAQFSYNTVIEKLLGNYKKREVFTKQERDDIIAYFYAKYPVTNKYLKSMFVAFFYIVDYYNFLAYKKMNLTSTDSLKRTTYHLINGKRMRIGNFCSQFIYIEDKQVQEDLWANELLLALPIGTPEPIEETIGQFKEIFPQSKWNPIIDKVYADVKSKNKIEYVLQSPIHYIDSTKSIGTFDSLLAVMPENKAVFVDLWASWCGPCITAFQFNKQLDTFLINNHIERLYISFDTKANQQVWRQAINRYALGGYHIIASQPLIKDIQRIYSIPENGPISIPRYLLISKQHKIIKTELISPIQTNELEAEIASLLLKN
jgi:thiol-disulfide isomerase/thioredoxin